MKKKCFALASSIVMGAASSADAQGLTGGTPVGRPVLLPVGQQVAPAAPKAGTAIGYRGLDGNPIGSTPPPGQVVDLNNLAAPLTAPLPPGMGPQQKPIWQKAYDGWRSLLGLDKPAMNLQTNWVPGLGRRTRERREATWRRD